jgi:uncharacterized membrane protein YcaP (DUF421 family)
MYSVIRITLIVLTLSFIMSALTYVLANNRIQTELGYNQPITVTKNGEVIQVIQ